MPREGLSHQLHPFSQNFCKARPSRLTLERRPQLPEAPSHPVTYSPSTPSACLALGVQDGQSSRHKKHDVCVKAWSATKSTDPEGVSIEKPIPAALRSECFPREIQNHERESPGVAGGWGPEVGDSSGVDE